MVAAADSRMIVPSSAVAGAPIGSPGGSPSSARKRKSGAAQSSVDKSVEHSAKVKALISLNVDGIDPKEIAKVDKGKDEVAVAKNLKALEVVSDQNTILNRTVKEVVVEQDGVLAKLADRVLGLGEARRRG